MTNKEKLFEVVLETLGAKNISSKTQKKNGTSMWRLATGETVAEYSSGYVRKIIYSQLKGREHIQHTCWQLNPTKNEKRSWTSPDGTYTREWIARERIMLNSREERLQKILNYTAKKLKNDNK